MKRKLIVVDNILSVLFAFCIVFIMAEHTSPIIDKYDYGSDSGIFLYCGKALKEGLKLYVDIFDHKGPILFFINALSWFIADSKWGIFLLEILNMFWIIYMAFKTCNIYLSQCSERKTNYFPNL